MLPSSLGVGRARVNQLIRSGMLAAEKWAGYGSSTSRAWKRVATPLRRRGVLLQVPAKGDVGRYVLMNRTHEVLSFRYDEAAGAFVDAWGTSSILREPRWA